MGILKKLQSNKGTTSSALSKSLAQKILEGEIEILHEAIDLVFFDDKNVRSGASKIVEIIAEKKPEFVAPYIKRLLSALEFPEPQTRWMILNACGLCSKLDPETVKQALPKAKKILEEESGTCLVDRSINYIGNLGSVSNENAKLIFPILDNALASVPKRTTRILEGFERMVPVLDKSLKEKLIKISKQYIKDSSPTIKKRALKIIKKLNSI